MTCVGMFPYSCGEYYLVPLDQCTPRLWASSHWSMWTSSIGNYFSEPLEYSYFIPVVGVNINNVAIATETSSQHWNTQNEDLPKYPLYSDKPQENISKHFFRHHFEAMLFFGIQLEIERNTLILGTVKKSDYDEHDFFSNSLKQIFLSHICHKVYETAEHILC